MTTFVPEWTILISLGIMEDSSIMLIQLVIMGVLENILQWDQDIRGKMLIPYLLIKGNSNQGRKPNNILVEVKV